MSKTREDIVNNPNELSFLDHAAEMQLAIINASGTPPVVFDTMKRMAFTGRTAHGFFKPELNKLYEQFVKPLLIDVLQGNIPKVVAVARQYPEFFFIKVTAEAPATSLEGDHPIIRGWSPYQAMFGTDNPKMLQAVKPYLDAYLENLKLLPVGYEHLQSGFELAAAQEQEKFPDGFDKPPCTPEFTQLATNLAEAITKDEQLRINRRNPKAETIDAMNNLRKYFKPGVVEMGYHFNLNNLIKLHEISDRYWDENKWNWEQTKFFDVDAIGSTQRLMTAWQLYVSCKGIKNYLDQPVQSLEQVQLLEPSFEIMNYVTNKKVTIVPFSGEDLSCRLGSGFLIDSYSGGGRVGGWCVGLRNAAAWETMSSEHSRAFRTLCTCRRDNQLRRA